MHKKIYIGFFACILLPVSAAASDFLFSLENRIGMISGLSQEYVYENDKEISRLEWEEQGIPFTDLSLCFAWKGLFITGTVSAAVPLQSGVMRNYDYLLSYSNELTNFSKHDVFLERHSRYKIGIGYEFTIKKWQMGFLSGFQYSNRKWTASDGYFQYAAANSPLTGDEPTGKFVGAVITYNQKISFFHIDVSAGYHILDTLFVGLQFNYYPYIWIENIDHHIIRSLEFFDAIPGAMGGMAGLVVKYKPFQSKNVELIAGLNFEKVFHKKGGTAQRTTGAFEESEFKLTNNHYSGYDSEDWYFFMGIKYSLLF